MLVSRPYHLVNEFDEISRTGTIGMPEYASKEKGEQFLSAAVEAVVHERVPHGASGHETDKRSASSPPGTRLLAKGTNPEDGGAEMVWFQTPSGGEVFSAGSITYVASLLADEHTSRITANVLSRFLR